MTPRRILLIFNPAAGGNRRIRLNRVIAALEARGAHLHCAETRAPGDAERIAREALASDIDVIVAAGGDGTINEVINGLDGKTLALGIIPLGTANVLADEIGLSKDPDAIAQALMTGPIRDIYVGRANGRRFTMMAGVGFDATVVARVSVGLKKWLGPLAYVWESAKQLAHYGFEACEATVDGRAYHPVSVVACNGRRYGGPFMAAPAASLRDNSFQVVLMNGRGWTSIVRYGLGLMFGRLAAANDVQIVVGRDVTIAGPPGQPVQADGDVVATLPLRITVDPEPVRLIYPV